MLALGTTDTANVAVGSTVSRAARIDRMMSVIGNEPVLWVNVKTLVTTGAWSNPNMLLWDQALVAARAKYPNITIYDWAVGGAGQLVRLGPGPLHLDRLPGAGPPHRRRIGRRLPGLEPAFPARKVIPAITSVPRTT